MHAGYKDKKRKLYSLFLVRGMAVHDRLPRPVFLAGSIGHNHLAVLYREVRRRFDVAEKLFQYGKNNFKQRKG